MRFDPMLEGNSGWMSREAPKLDIEKEDVVIELLAEASQHISKDVIDPCRTHIGEVFPLNVERNLSGFFIKKDGVPLKVDFQKLLSHILHY